MGTWQHRSSFAEDLEAGTEALWHHIKSDGAGHFGSKLIADSSLQQSSVLLWQNAPVT